MTVALALALLGLALIDSTSIGTLYIPIWLMLTPGPVAAGRLLAYLAIVAGLYFLVGILILLGADAVFARLGGAWEAGGPLDIAPVNGALVVVGLAMLAYSIWPIRRGNTASRLNSWRDRAAISGSVLALAALGTTTVVLELATMLPYLAAMALISATGLDWLARLLTLAAYCLVMIVPATALLVLRIRAEEKIRPALDWFDNQVRTRGGEAALWGLGIVGVLVAGFGGSRLFA